MNDLSMDAFEGVFSYLSLHELLISEQVCKKWCQVASWYWKRIKRVSLSVLMNIKMASKCELVYSQEKVPIHRIALGAFYSLAKRCGDNVRHLEIGFPLKMNVNSLNVLASEFPRLQYLDLSKTILILPSDEDGNEELREFRMSFIFDELRTLRMDACLDESVLAYYSFDSVDPMLFKVFSSIPSIESLSLAQNTLLNGSCLFGLSTSLKSLDLGFCRRMTSDTLRSVFNGLPNLKHISLYSNSGLMGDCLSHLSSGLESIDLSYCDSLDADSLVQFFSSHTQLRNVQLAHARGVTNIVLNSVVESLESSLEALNLSWYLHTTYYEGHVHPHDIVKGVKLLGVMKSLKQLDLSRNDFVLDNSLIIISHGCENLEDLNVSQLANVTQYGFCSLGRLKHLKRLDISDNDCVDEAVLLSVAHGGKLEFVNARRCVKIKEATIRRLGGSWPNKVTIFQVY